MSEYVVDVLPGYLPGVIPQNFFDDAEKMEFMTKTYLEGLAEQDYNTDTAKATMLLTKASDGKVIAYAFTKLSRMGVPPHKERHVIYVDVICSYEKGYFLL